MIEAYPLFWPVEYPRTKYPARSRFVNNTLGKARDSVKEEIKRLGGTLPVISTNIPLKNDGDLRADWSKFKIDDHGVAVYFTYKGNQVCLCCDKYDKIWDNLRAVARTIEALRQIDRDGVSDFLNRAFTGFQALPEAPAEKPWWEILGIHQTATEEEVKEAFRRLAHTQHPDKGGDPEKWTRLFNSYQSALKSVK